MNSCRLNLKRCTGGGRRTLCGKCFLVALRMCESNIYRHTAERNEINVVATACQACSLVLHNSIGKSHFSWNKDDCWRQTKHNMAEELPLFPRFFETRYYCRTHDSTSGSLATTLAPRKLYCTLYTIQSK